MSPDITWSYRPVTLCLRFFGLSVVSFSEYCRNEIWATYTKCLCCGIIVSSGVLIYNDITATSDYVKSWSLVGINVSSACSVLYNYWTTLTEFRKVIVIFENIKSIDKSLKRLDHSIDHRSNKKCICIHIVLLVVFVTTFGAMRTTTISCHPVRTYLAQVIFVQLLEGVWVMMADFYLIVMALRQRWQVLRRCLKNVSHRTSPDISVLCVLPAVESTRPSTSSDQHNNITNEIIKDLFEAQRSISDYFSASATWIAINTVITFARAAFVSQSYKSVDQLIRLLFFLTLQIFYTVLTFLSCTLLQIDIANVRNEICSSNISTVNNKRRKMKHLTLKMIHEKTEISCGLFDINLNVVPTAFNVMTVLVFAILQK